MPAQEHQYTASKDIATSLEPLHDQQTALPAISPARLRRRRREPDDDDHGGNGKTNESRYGIKLSANIRFSMQFNFLFCFPHFLVLCHFNNKTATFFSLSTA